MTLRELRQDADRLLSLQEVAELFHRSTDTICRWAGKGVLKPVDVPGPLLFHGIDVLVKIGVEPGRATPAERRREIRMAAREALSN